MKPIFQYFPFSNRQTIQGYRKDCLDSKLLLFHKKSFLDIHVWRPKMFRNVISLALPQYILIQAQFVDR